MNGSPDLSSQLDVTKSPRVVPFLVPLMTRAQRFEYILCVATLLCALFFFWKWWLEPGHNINTTWFVLSSIAIAWVSLVPLYLILVFSRSRVPAKILPLSVGYRVAMVVTKAPSEPFSIVRETLEGMLRQRYPHDTWLADEDPSSETIEWCRRRGVLISTRKDKPDYHRVSWPRRTRCKEGNLAFFYDHHGYENYDFVLQLDADHVPEEGYLEEMLRPFIDPRVGYVSAPSICDSNAHESWSARGRLYGEAGLHGPLQVLAITGSRSKIIHKPLPADDPKQRQPDITLARERLGWQPKVPLDQGLQQAIAYFDQRLSGVVEEFRTVPSAGR